MTTTTPTSTAAERPAPGRAVRILVWSVRILLAVFFVAAAMPKLTGTQQAPQMFAEIGAGQWLRYLVGVAEVAGGVGLLVPRLAGLAAAGLALDMLGATIINATVLHSSAVVMTVPLCAVFVLLARYRWRQSGGPLAALRR